MLTNETKRKLTGAGVFALPVALVWGTGVMFGGPTSVQADTALPASGRGAIALLPDPGTGPRDPAQEAAVMHIVYLLEQPFERSPLYHLPRGSHLPVADPQVPGAPSFTVNGVLGSSRGNTALINGESYEVGDELADSGWTIAEIDAVRRLVTIEDPETGRRVRRYVDTRFIENRVDDENGEGGDEDDTNDGES